MIQFQAKYLPALTAFMAKNDIRYYLNGIHIHPHADGGAVLVATDGCRLLAIRDIEAHCDEEIIFKIAPGLARLCKRKNAIVTINTITERLTISDDDGELFVQPGRCLIVAKYVNYKNCMPDFAKLKMAVADHIRSNYLAEAAAAHPGYGSTRLHDKNAIRLWQEDPMKAVIVEYAGYPEYCGVIMPVRCDVDGPINDWQKHFGQAELPGMPVAA